MEFASASLKKKTYAEKQRAFDFFYLTGGNQTVQSIKGKGHQNPAARNTCKRAEEKKQKQDIRYKNTTFENGISDRAFQEEGSF